MGKRSSVRQSIFGTEIAVMEHMHWTHQELNDQPAELIDELMVKLAALARAERKKSKIAEMEATE